MFPKKIHQSWVDFNKNGSLSDNQIQWSNTWRQLNSSYEYKLWNKQENDELISDYYSEYKGAYDSYDREIKRVDFVRSCYMHKYGGIYADLDFECLKSFDPLLEQYSEYDVILGEMWTDDSKDAHASTSVIGSILNAFMISKAGSDFWPHHMDVMASRNVNGHTEEYSTGAIAFRDAYLTYANREKILILPKEYFFPLSWVQVLNRPIGSRISDPRGLRNSALSGTITEQQKQDSFPGAYAVTYWDESWKDESLGDEFLPV